MQKDLTKIISYQIPIPKVSDQSESPAIAELGPAQPQLVFLIFSDKQKLLVQAGAELGQAQPKLGLKVGVCILGWRWKHEVEF